MKTGIILKFHIAGLPVEAFGVYSEEDGIILDGNIQLGVEGDLRSTLESLLGKVGCTVSLSFFPQITVDRIWMTYRNNLNEMSFGLKLKDNDKELGRIQTFLKNKEVSICFSYMQTLQFSEIPVVGDWIGKGSFGPIQLLISPHGDLQLYFSYAFAGKDEKIVIDYPASDSRRTDVAFHELRNGPEIRWKPWKKSLGCINLLAVGGTLWEGNLYVMLQSELHLSILTITLEGLGICIPFSDLKNIHPLLTGLGLGVKTDAIQIAGFFSKELNKTSYSGQLTVQIGSFGFSLIGSYEQNPYTSVFAVGVLQMKFAGTGCINIKKIAVGFGYNRLLQIPKLDSFQEFALLKFMDGSISKAEVQNNMPAQQGQHWLAAGIRFESYHMIQGDVVASVLFGNLVRVDLIGKMVLDLSIDAKGNNAHNTVLAHVVLLIQASFQPESGLIAIEAMLGGDSYLLSRNCHVTGGFACYIWYEKEHKGDFVITLGGYHRDYKKPAHYPSVSSLGLKWQITSELLVQGSIYFAVTPAHLMAGGSLQMLFEAGCIKAWFDVKLDILIQWNPFSYDFSVSISLGISVKLFFATIKLEVGCSLHLWGPEFSGIARIKLWIISFDIKFIKNAPDSVKKIEWALFRKDYLPAETAENRDSKNNFRGCNIQINNQQIRENLIVFIKTPLPITAYQINDFELQILDEVLHTPGIYPCRIEKLKAILYVKIYKCDAAKKDEAINFEDLYWKAETEQVPCGLWGTKQMQDTKGNWKQEIFEAYSGLSMKIKDIWYEEKNVSIFNEVSFFQQGEPFCIPCIEGQSYDQSESYEKISEITEEKTKQKRKMILESFGYDDSNINFGDEWNHADQISELFREPPYLETLGAYDDSEKGREKSNSDRTVRSVLSIRRI